MANSSTTIQVTAETEYLEAFLAQLKSRLIDASPEVRKLASDMLKNPAELMDIECRITSRTSLAVLFKPSSRLLGLYAAAGRKPCPHKTPT